MQQPVCANLRSRRNAWVGLACLLAVGCGPDQNPGPNPQAKPFAGVSLTVRCSDAAFARAITPAAESWATLKGAKVAVQVGPMTSDDSADLGILPAAEFGAWAARGDLAPVPGPLRAADHPLQWGNILAPYREQAIVWGGQAQALPLAGDGFVIVYRADRLEDPKFVAAFRTASGREPGPPASWEDFADLAAALAKHDGKPSLPALTEAEAADLFFRVAACYDRRAMNEGDAAKLGAGLDVLSFQHDMNTGAARLDSAGFRAAADWLGGLAARNCLPKTPGADPATALAKGEAALAMLSLAQLSQLPRENGAVPPRFKLAPLPGTRTHFSPEKQQLVSAGVPNYVPYFSGGRLGVVRSRCPHPDAAFDLLAELAGTSRSLELLSTPGLGAGPFRTTHLDRDRLSTWFGYGFDPERTAALQGAMRAYLRADVKNPTYGLRGPDQGELNAAASAVWGKVARGELSGADGLSQLTAAWKAIDAKTPAETRIRWRKQAAGVR